MHLHGREGVKQDYQTSSRISSCQSPPGCLLLADANDQPGFERATRRLVCQRGPTRTSPVPSDSLSECTPVSENGDPAPSGASTGPRSHDSVTCKKSMCMQSISHRTKCPTITARLRWSSRLRESALYGAMHVEYAQGRAVRVWGAFVLDADGPGLSGLGGHLLSWTVSPFSLASFLAAALDLTRSRNSFRHLECRMCSTRMLTPSPCIGR